MPPGARQLALLRSRSARADALSAGRKFGVPALDGGEAEEGGVASNTIRIWDPFIRIGHWVIVGGFALAYLTEEDLLSFHVWAGYTVGAVVLFRILWGFIGPHLARFADFLYRPRTVLAYLTDLIRLRGRRYLGHSPAGGAMVVALLLGLAATVVTGLMAYGADRKAGPLAFLGAASAPSLPAASREKQVRIPASGEDGDGRGEGEATKPESAIRELHELFANLTLALVIAHVAGVGLASFVHHENLVRSMVTGRKRTDGMEADPGP